MLRQVEIMLDFSDVNNEITTMLLLGLTSFVLGMLITPIYTYFAYRYKAWKVLRATATTGESATVLKQLHAEKHKRHIPTMAGLIMVVAITLVTVVFNLSREQTLLPIGALLGAGLVGLIDDLINIRGLGRGVAGLQSWLKLLLILTVAAIGAWFFYYKLGYSTISIPWVTDNLEIGFLLVPLFIFIVLATANAVNITDGLDGLAGCLLPSAFGAYAVFAFLQGNYGIAGFCVTVVGALLSYTWFNIYPARFFMGDVGSFALGTALGVVAMLTDTVALLPLIGLVFVVEAGSSSLQILSKKLRGKKIWRSAPIHHHFEAIGWPETKVTMRFWIVGQVVGTAGIIIAILADQV